MDKTKEGLNSEYNIELIKENVGILYKTSYSRFGYKAAENAKNPEYGHNGRFSTVFIKSILLAQETIDFME